MFQKFIFSILRYVLPAHHKPYHRHLRHKIGRSPPPFSVNIQNASFPISSFNLSSLRIDHASCHPQIQTSCKQFRFTQINQRLQRHRQQRFHISNRFLQIILFPLHFLIILPTVHAVPSTKYSC